jgi:hypothetical protein
VNDITVPVKIPGENSVKEETNPIVEIQYDNVDINKSNEPAVDPERLKRLMTNMEVKEEVNVIKSDEIATFENKSTPYPEPGLEPESKPEPEPEPDTTHQPRFTLNNLYPTMNTYSSNDKSSENNNEIPKVEIVTNDLHDIKEDKMIVEAELKSPRKEMVSVKNEDDIDETSSLANFFDDMKQIVEDKGIKVEKNNDKMFTLFEDANEVEKT